MLIRKLEEFEQLSLSEKSALFDRLALYPAISIAVWVRKDIGARLISPYVGVTAFFMWVVWIFMLPSRERTAVGIMAACTTIFGIANRIARWKEFRRGVRQHSYYLGTSNFCKPWLPLFFRRNRRMESFVDFPVLLITGAFLLRFSSIVGLWIIFSSLCLLSAEGMMRHRMREQEMDLVDGMIKAEVQTESVERFSESPPPQEGHDTGAVSTGLGADIEKKIKARRKR